MRLFPLAVALASASAVRAACVADNCYNNIKNQKASAFCASFTTNVATAATALPSGIQTSCGVARLSSACSCIYPSQTSSSAGTLATTTITPACVYTTITTGTTTTETSVSVTVVTATITLPPVTSTVTATLTVTPVSTTSVAPTYIATVDVPAQCTEVAQSAKTYKLFYAGSGTRPTNFASYTFASYYRADMGPCVPIRSCSYNANVYSAQSFYVVYRPSQSSYACYRAIPLLNDPNIFVDSDSDAGLVFAYA